MKTADQWFDEYGQSHQNPINKAIHWVCVPAIAFSTVGLLQAVPLPLGELAGGWLHLGTLTVALAGLFYLRLSWTLGAAMILVSAPVLLGNAAIAEVASLWKVSLVIFALAWVVQLIGHQIEGKKPSFAKDLQFLLIGPAWLMGFIFRGLGLRY